FASLWKPVPTRKGKDRLHSRATFAQVASHLPEAPDGGRNAKSLLGAPFGDAPVEGGAKVVVVQLQAVELRLALVAEQPPLCSLSQRGEGGRVAIANEIGLTAFLEAFACELADGLQHDQPRLVEIGLAPQQALVRELFKTGDHIGSALFGPAADRLRLLESSAASKHREPGQQALQSGIEQLIAPRDRAGERLLATREIAGAGAQRAQALLQPCEEGLRREQLAPRRGQFDCERQAVHSLAAAGDGGRVLGGGVEVGLRRKCPLDEQLDRLVLGEGFERRVRLRVGQIERLDGELLLAVGAQRRPAAVDHLLVRAALEERSRKARRLGKQLLEVVHDQQDFPG